MTFFPLPHPSGLAVVQDTIHVASTRNPNQLFEFGPVRSDNGGTRPYLVPLRSRIFPGRLYLHDIASIGGILHGTAVGLNAIVSFRDSEHELAWWPMCVERGGRPDLSKNYLQLNSIAAGASLQGSFFSASSDRISRVRPGHVRFPVERRGVIFSGRTREPVVLGLTRPHSARLFRDALWVDNSGYGEVGVALDGRFEPVAKLPGWTRGLTFAKGVAFVGVSRVIPKFRRYAPGLDFDASSCGVFAVDTRSGKNLASLVWPHGNQIFAVETVPASNQVAFPFAAGRARKRDRRDLFYSFHTKERR
jgi:uncharacterized protein (TIGR03032 family)